LAEHPDVAAELETQQRLSRHNRKLWKASAPLVPSEGNWARVFGRVQDVLDAPVRPAPPRPTRRRHLLRYAVAALSTAAAAAVALHMSGPTPPPVVNPEPPAAVEGYAFASDADVDIISIDDRDTSALVVGRPPLPLTGAVVLASAGDVQLQGVQKAEDGMLPKTQMTEAVPMIIAPLAGR
jgi:hypothetical protein